MARKNKQPTQNIRSRRPSRTVDSSFRRNNVVVSRAQKEVAARQRSVTQRQIEKKHEKRVQSRRYKIGIIILISVAIVFFFRSSITGVALTSNASNTVAEDQQTAYEASILKIYKKHTIASQSWMADTTAISNEFTTQHPEVERLSLAMQTPLSTVMKADIRFRSPVFTYKDASGVQQFVDKNGVLFYKNMDAAVNTGSLIQIEDQSGVVLKAGTSVITNDVITFVGQLHTIVPKTFGAKKKITGVIIPRSTREVQIKVSDTPYVVKFNSFRDINQQVGELTQLLAFLANQKITPQQYIDLRVEHKAFYK